MALINVAAGSDYNTLAYHFHRTEPGGDGRARPVGETMIAPPLVRLSVYLQGGELTHEVFGVLVW